MDDPIKTRQDADSPTIRDRVWEEWQNSLKSRFAAGAKVIVIMTPWHEDDLAGRLLRQEIHVEQLRLPVEADLLAGCEPDMVVCERLLRVVHCLIFFCGYVSGGKCAAMQI